MNRPRMTLAEYNARPEYDPFEAYKDFQAHPENYVLVSDIVRELMPGIVQYAALKEMKSCRSVEACRQCYLRWREKLNGTDPGLIELLSAEGTKMREKLKPKVKEAL